MPIPDGTPGGVGVILDVPNSCVIEELHVAIDLTHSRIGDLRVTLQHEDVVVVLMDRPGFPEQPNGCETDFACGQPVYLNDGGAIPLDCGANCQACFPGGVVGTGFYIPFESLTAFEDRNMMGPWQLRVQDLAPGAQGVVCKLELIVACQAVTGIEGHASAEKVPNDVPTLFVSPNPFNPLTSIEFTLPQSDHAELTILSSGGRLVTRLLEGALDAGRHTASWNGQDASGARVPSGAYVVVLRTSRTEAVQKLLLLK